MKLEQKILGGTKREVWLINLDEAGDAIGGRVVDDFVSLLLIFSFFFVG